MNQPSEQLACDEYAEGGNRVWIMPFGTKAARPEAGSRTVTLASVVRDGRRAQRGKTVPLGDQEPLEAAMQGGA